MGPDRGALLVEAQTDGQPVTGASCIVTTGNGSWPLITPATVLVGDQAGDLRVMCNKTGFRTSEYWFRRDAMRASGVSLGLGFGSGGGFGLGLGVGMPLRGPGARYPSRIVIDMNPS